MSIHIRTGKGNGAKVTVPLAAGALVCLGLGAGAAGAAGLEPAGAAATGPKAAVASKAAKITTVKGTITGASGMTLVLLSNAGKVAARKKLNSAGAISLRARAGYSLHLIGRDGAYAGPVVLATSKNGATVYQYFKGTAGTLDLGTVKVARGYAVAGTNGGKKGKVLRQRLMAAVDPSAGASANAKKGRPLAAGYQGVVAVSTKSMLSAAALRTPAADLDRDGYVNVFDIDSNGNKVLNNVDSKRRNGSIRPPSSLSGPRSQLRALAQVEGVATLVDPPPPPSGDPSGPPPSGDPTGPPPTGPPPSGPPPSGDPSGPPPSGLPSGGPAPAPGTATSLSVFSNYKATSDQLSDVINANLFATGATSAEILAAIDASLVNKTTLAVQSISGATYTCGMAYCPSGTWTAPAGGTGDFQWNIGLGSGAAGIPAFPGLDHTEIGSGDTFIATGADGTAVPGVLNFAFVTTPALKSFTTYDAGGAVVTTGTVDYSLVPIKGSRVDPIQVPAGGTVRLDWYVPQRLTNSGEVGFGPDSIFVNQGNLNYHADLPNQPTGVTGSGSGGNCSSFKDLATGAALPGEAVADSTGDNATAGRTYSFRISIDDCVNAKWSASGGVWTTADFDIKAQSPNGGDNAAQKLYFSRN